MKNTTTLKKIKKSLEDKKGMDIQVLDVRDLVSYADYLVLCTGTSSAHVHALVSNVREAFPKAGRPTYVNQSKDDSWWIVDFVDVVVHIFKEEARVYYNLEDLWSDAERVESLD